MNDKKSQIEQLAIDRNNPQQTNSKYLYWVGSSILSTLLVIVLVISLQSKAPVVIVDATKAETAPEALNKKHQQDRVLDASGHIVARRIATVSSRVTGKINQLNIEEGQSVRRGEILAELDDRQARISYQLAIADLAAREATLEELNILYQHEILLSKRRQTLANNNLVSDEVAESSAMKTHQIAAQIKNKSALIDQAKQRVALAQYQLDQHKIRAPFDAVIISKNAQVGELISAGSSGGGFIRTGVGTIVDMSSLEIEVEVGESYINRVFPGQQVEAKLDAYPKWNIESQVVAIIPTADRQKATIKVRVKLLQSDPRILPDMSIKVSFLSSTPNPDKAPIIASNQLQKENTNASR